MQVAENDATRSNMENVAANIVKARRAAARKARYQARKRVKEAKEQLRALAAADTPTGFKPENLYPKEANSASVVPGEDRPVSVPAYPGADDADGQTDSPFDARLPTLRRGEARTDLERAAEAEQTAKLEHARVDRLYAELSAHAIEDSLHKNAGSIREYLAIRGAERGGSLQDDRHLRFAPATLFHRIRGAGDHSFLRDAFAHHFDERRRQAEKDALRLRQLRRKHFRASNRGRLESRRAGFPDLFRRDLDKSANELIQGHWSRILAQSQGVDRGEPPRAPPSARPLGLTAFGLATHPDTRPAATRAAGPRIEKLVQESRRDVVVDVTHRAAQQYARQWEAHPGAHTSPSTHLEVRGRPQRSFEAWPDGPGARAGVVWRQHRGASQQPGRTNGIRRAIDRREGRAAREMMESVGALPSSALSTGWYEFRPAKRV
jgi:hypothetical protein